MTAAQTATQQMAARPLTPRQVAYLQREMLRELEPWFKRMAAIAPSSRIFYPSTGRIEEVYSPDDQRLRDGYQQVIDMIADRYARAARGH